MEPCLAPQLENGMLVITWQGTARRHYKALYTAPEPSGVKAGTGGKTLAALQDEE